MVYKGWLRRGPAICIPIMKQMKTLDCHVLFRRQMYCAVVIDSHPQMAAMFLLCPYIAYKRVAIMQFAAANAGTGAMATQVTSFGHTLDHREAGFRQDKRLDLPPR